MVKNWQNPVFVANFLTKFSLFDEQKNGIFGGNILWSLTSPISVVSQCKLVSGWKGRKWKSAPPYKPYHSGRT